MQSMEYTHDPPGERRVPDLTELLALFGEEAVADPEDLEGALRRLFSRVRDLLGLAAVGLSAVVGESRRVSVTDSLSDDELPAGEFPIPRGKTMVGLLKAYTEGGKGLDAWQTGGLRAVASAAALALDAAHAREASARRAAQGNAVQIASEALGSILDEEDLYRTVLVLTLELLDASGGAVLLEDGTAVSLGLDGEATLAGLRNVELDRRQRPWTGQVGRCRALGVGLGQAEPGGAIFLVRDGAAGAYTPAEGGTLKLVARQLARARERSKLYASLERTSLEAISALAAALESRDDTTGEHIKRTQRLAGEVARRLGFGPEEVRAARYAAVLHDVGKIAIPDSILNKPGKLTLDEWAVMRRHAEIGAGIVARISGFDDVAQVVLAHHERHDGRGYPHGLAGHDIPACARLISVVDAYDAMTNDRPYRKALPHEEAVAELQKHSGSQFDPEVIEALKAIFQEESHNSKETQP